MASGAGIAADNATQAQMQQEIEQLVTSLDSQQTESDTLQDDVTRLEKKLGSISEALNQTENAIEETQAELQANNASRQKLETELNQERTNLAQQLQALYVAGEESPLRLLLRQDNPSDLSRTVHYFDYINQSRVKRIKKIQKTLDDLHTTRNKIDKNQKRLQTLNQQQEQQKAEITTTLSTRNDHLKRLSSDIRAKQKRMNKLRTEDASLQEIVDRLSQPVTAEKPNDTAKASPTTTVKDTPTATPIKASYSPNQPFTSLKGALSWPISGKIVRPFGSVKNEKQRWQGVVIAAAGGTKVKAIAKGKVVFADWMDAYGHMVIIEHDNGYMSVYGYNRAIHKKKGAIVNANETIATVGSSGGQEQDGLYFEIRQGKSTLNPAKWCR